MIPAVLLEEIELQNEFLNKKIEYKPRELAKKISSEQKYGLIQLIKGIRRAGKTVLMKKLLKNYKNSFYFSFEEERFCNVKTLNEVIKFAISNNKKIIGLDEIQKVRGWAGTLKKYYDMTDVKFILSGSSAVEITKGKESLAGRMLEYNLHLLSFSEFRAFGGKTFSQFLQTGFPELVLKPIPPEKYISTIVEKIVYEDLPRRYEIHRPDVLMDLVQLLTERNCNLIDYRDLASDLEISKDTVKTYIFYLQQSYLLNIVPVFSRRVSTSKRRLKKVFFNFPSIPEIYYKQTEGQMVENVIYSELSKYFNVTFWREKNNEVDFVVNKIPIEVKYTSREIKSHDIKGLLHFMDKFNIKKGVVVCKYDSREKINGKTILFIDTQKFLSSPLKYLKFLR